MFIVEYFNNLSKIKNITPSLKDIDFGLWERVIGILLWPMWLSVFLYNFFKQLFK